MQLIKKINKNYINYVTSDFECFDLNEVVLKNGKNGSVHMYDDNVMTDVVSRLYVNTSSIQRSSLSDFNISNATLLNFFKRKERKTLDVSTYECDESLLCDYISPLGFNNFNLLLSEVNNMTFAQEYRFV